MFLSKDLINKILEEIGLESINNSETEEGQTIEECEGGEKKQKHP